MQTYSAKLYEPEHELVTAATENCQHHRSGNVKKKKQIHFLSKCTEKHHRNKETRFRYAYNSKSSLGLAVYQRNKLSGFS